MLKLVVDFLDYCFIGLLNDCFVKFPYNFVTIFYLVGEVNDLLVKFVELRYALFVKVPQILILCEPLKLPPHPLTITR